MLKAQKYTIKFLEKQKLNKEIFEFRFTKPSKLKFKPGQYLKMFLQISNPDSRGSSRYFTISSSPLSEFISITTKVGKSSFKRTLKKLKKGDEVSIFAPIGYFDLNHKDSSSKVFLAGGIGITPYHSILKTLEKKRLNFEIYLFVSFSNLKDVIYFNELKVIERDNKKIKVIYTLSKERAVGFEHGRINIDMIKKHFPNLHQGEFYVVGSEKTERKFLEMLKSAGIKEERIFSENFPGY